ncbi:MAG: Gfo/Idh/MocA family oxidoreductase [Opitutales bacterium]|nr:Gfo/Idh/MocA family oxidoreductase [Opitutales bacterium]
MQSVDRRTFSTPVQTLRCGVVGVGFLGQHHARIYSDMVGAQLVGVCDASAERAAEIAAKYGCKAFTDPVALAKECDAVSIVVPTDLHHKVAIQLLPLGVHLFIEKPLCASSREGEEILEAAHKAGVLVQVGHIEQFNPVIGYLEKVINAPRFITADRLAPFNPRGTEVGVVLDLMIHDIGVILQLVNSPIERIEAVGVSVVTKREDIANARLSFANGCVANVNTSRISEKKVRELRVFQPDAYLSLDYMNQTGHVLRKTPTGLQREEIPIEKGEPLRIELESFTSCVRERRTPKVDASFGKTALEIALEITAQIEAAGNRA